MNRAAKKKVLVVGAGIAGLIAGIYAQKSGFDFRCPVYKVWVKDGKACSIIQNGMQVAGQRIQPPGGLPVVITTGRKGAQVLCRDHGLVFG
jgi:glycine/D-amino acid oxidase-like deaminating enzyme